MVSARLAPVVSEASLESLRLFPLPDTVFFPGTMLPLHVFEPRYRALVADALAKDKVLAIALIKAGQDEDEGTPQIHDVVGVGQITHVQRAQDGRYYLGLQGLCRARVVRELRSDLPYRVAKAQWMPDILPEGGEAALDEEVQVLKTCLVKLVSHLPQRANALGELLEHVTTPGALADVLCAAGLETAEQRQRALDTTSVAERIRMATEAIAELIIKTDLAEGTAATPM